VRVSSEAKEKATGQPQSGQVVNGVKKWAPETQKKTGTGAPAFDPRSADDKAAAERQPAPQSQSQTQAQQPSPQQSPAQHQQAQPQQPATQQGQQPAEQQTKAQQGASQAQPQQAQPQQAQHQQAQPQPAQGQQPQQQAQTQGQPPTLQQAQPQQPATQQAQPQQAQAQQAQPQQPQQKPGKPAGPIPEELQKYRDRLNDPEQAKAALAELQQQFRQGNLWAIDAMEGVYAHDVYSAREKMIDATVQGFKTARTHDEKVRLAPYAYKDTLAMNDAQNYLRERARAGDEKALKALSGMGWANEQEAKKISQENRFNSLGSAAAQGDRDALQQLREQARKGSWDERRALTEYLSKQIEAGQGWALDAMPRDEFDRYKAVQSLTKRYQDSKDPAERSRLAPYILESTKDPAQFKDALASLKASALKGDPRALEALARTGVSQDYQLRDVVGSSRELFQQAAREGQAGAAVDAVTRAYADSPEQHDYLRTLGQAANFLDPKDARLGQVRSTLREQLGKNNGWALAGMNEMGGRLGFEDAQAISQYAVGRGRLADGAHVLNKSLGNLTPEQRQQVSEPILAKARERMHGEGAVDAMRELKTQLGSKDFQALMDDARGSNLGYGKKSTDLLVDLTGSGTPEQQKAAATALVGAMAGTRTYGGVRDEYHPQATQALGQALAGAQDPAVAIL